MPGTPTPNLGLTVPTVGGDNNTWGGELNGDLAIIDGLGAAGVVKVSANYAAVVGIFPETIVMMTTGGSNKTVTLLAPSACAGRIWNIKKADSGAGSVSIVPTSGLIDGASSWSLVGQYSNVRVLSDGVNYAVL